MIESNLILRRAEELKACGKDAAAKLLLHLQSYLSDVDGQGPARFTREIKEWFPEESKKLWWWKGGDGARLPIDDAIQHAYERFGVDCGTREFLDKILPEHMKRAAQNARESYYLTNIGRSIWETLDWCLEERRPCFIEGAEGRGKSEGAKAWFRAHRGEGRYASLEGISTQRDFFNALAPVYGVPFSNAKAPNEVRFRLRDAIVRSGLVLVIDEAHFALPERTYKGRPVLIDWIDCLCNSGVPIALVATPQFGPRLAEFENRTTWNARQFRRRFSGRWCQLPEKTADGDLVALAKRALPNVGEKGIKVAAKFAGGYGRDVSGLFDLVRDAQRRARKAGRDSANFQDLREAYELDRVPSENAMANSFAPFKSAVNKQQLTSRPAADQQLAGSRAATPETLLNGTGIRRTGIEAIQTETEII